MAQPPRPGLRDPLDPEALSDQRGLCAGLAGPGFRRGAPGQGRALRGHRVPERRLPEPARRHLPLRAPPPPRPDLPAAGPGRRGLRGPGPRRHHGGPELLRADPLDRPLQRRARPAPPGDGRGHFRAVPPAESGLVVPGTPRPSPSSTCSATGGRSFLATRNNAFPLAFRNRVPGPTSGRSSPASGAARETRPGSGALVTADIRRACDNQVLCRLRLLRPVAARRATCATPGVSRRPRDARSLAVRAATDERRGGSRPGTRPVAEP